MTQIAINQRRPAEAGPQASDQRRPLIPSDPWTVWWAPPSDADLASRHARARKRERDLARQGWDGIDPLQTTPERASAEWPRRKPRSWRHLPKKPRVSLPLE